MVSVVRNAVQFSVTHCSNIEQKESVSLGRQVCKIGQCRMPS